MRKHIKTIPIGKASDEGPQFDDASIFHMNEEHQLLHAFMLERFANIGSIEKTEKKSNAYLFVVSYNGPVPHSIKEDIKNTFPHVTIYTEGLKDHFYLKWHKLGDCGLELQTEDGYQRNITFKDAIRGRVGPFQKFFRMILAFVLLACVYIVAIQLLIWIKPERYRSLKFW